MVLQRDKPNAFWGWSSPGESVTVTIGARKAKGVAGSDGRWLVKLLPPKVGGPYQVVIAGSSQRVELDDVLVGDVWLCSGQSNMEFGLSQAKDGAAEVAAADEPNIRLYMAPRGVGYAPHLVNSGEWKVCSPKTVAENGWGGFSAVGYFFGRKLHHDLKVPIGLVEASWGGTSAEAWTSRQGLAPLGDFAPQLATIERKRAAGGPEFGTYTNLWLDENDQGRREGWEASEFDDSKWQTTTIPPGPIGDDSASAQESVWYRRTIEVPSGGAAELFLNRIDDTDCVWINGEFVGTTSFDWAWRRYPVRLKPGRNVIAVRVFTGHPTKTFLGTPEEIVLRPVDGPPIPLAGEWKARVGLNVSILSSRPRDGEPNPTVPTTLFNGMIAPLAPMAFRGAIWYQGETNSGRGAQYRKLLPAMILDWRRAFGQDFPFYIVSLANFMPRDPNPGDDGWAELRDAQAFAATTVPKSGLAVTIDVGDANDVHPKDKRTVGERLAAIALAKEYGRKIAYSGPVYQRVKREGTGLRVSFTQIHGGLSAKGALEGFAVAGADRKWRWAEARIEGNTIVVRSTSVPEPVAVRYAWGHNPAATLYNGAGSPAVPFRTDDWPMVSRDAK